MTISLRAIEPEDLDLLYRIENDTTLWNVGTSNVPYSRYLLHDYVAHATADIYTDRQVRMMIDDEQGQTVGIADIVNFDPASLSKPAVARAMPPPRSMPCATMPIACFTCTSSMPISTCITRPRSASSRRPAMSQLPACPNGYVTATSTMTPGSYSCSFE